jgi:hypothetical protein
MDVDQTRGTGSGAATRTETVNVPWPWLESVTSHLGSGHNATATIVEL